MTDFPLQEFIIPPETPRIRVDQWLQRHLQGPSRSEIQSWIRAEKVTLNGAACIPGTKISPGMTLCVTATPRTGPELPQPEDIPVEILFEDEHLVAIVKKAGQVVHPAPGHPGQTVLNAMLYHYPDLRSAGPEERPGLVHRLDADTSGVMLFARNTTALEHLQAQFKARTTEKIYRCMCRGVPHPIAQDITTPIGRHPHHRQKRCIHGTAAKEAFTQFTILRGLAGGEGAELEVQIKTGRTHQIRVHLDSVGHPVLGDPLYGGRRTQLGSPWTRAPRLMLHAAQITFTHPQSGKRISCTAPLPDDYLQLLEHYS